MRTKDDSVSLLGLSTQALFAMFVADQVAREHGEELWVTSGSETDTIHCFNSKHYSGDAFDMRIRFWSYTEAKQVAEEIQKRLGRHFDVILEANHIHIEYDPKCKKVKV